MIIGVAVAVTPGPVAPASGAPPAGDWTTTACCEVEAPTWLTFEVRGSTATARARSFTAVMRLAAADTAASAIDETLRPLGRARVVTRAANDTWKVRSGTYANGTRIFYLRVDEDAPCREIGVLLLTYPTKAKTQFANDVALMSRSFAKIRCYVDR